MKLAQKAEAAKKIAHRMASNLKEFKAVTNLNEFLGATWDLEKIFSKTLKVLNAHLPIDAGYYFLLNKQKHALEPAYPSRAGKSIITHGHTTQTAGNGVELLEVAAEWVVQHLEPLISENPTMDSRLVDRLKENERSSTSVTFPSDASALLAVPLVYRTTPVGALILVKHNREARFTTAHRRLAEVLAAQVTIAIQRSRIIDRFERRNQQLQEANRKLKAAEQQLAEWNRQLETEVEKRTKELREWRDFLQSVIDGIEDILLIVDKDRNILFANQAAQRKMGKPASELIHGKCFAEMFEGLSICDFCSATKTFSDGVAAQASFSGMGRDGSVHHYELSTFPIKNDRGEVEQVIEIIRDVSQKKQFEAQLLQSEKLASIGEVASGVAHEIRNPLAAIKMGLTFLRKAGKDPAEWEDTVESMSKDIARLDHVVSQLLNFARQKAPKMEPCPLSEDLEAALFYVSKSAKEQGIQIEKHFDKATAGGVDQIIADPGLVQQVFLNILLNAMQAMPHGGRLELAIHPGTDGNSTEVIIRDNGVGISPEDLPKVMNPFYTTKPGGTGLG
ncbi:MAG: GAF domain-containing sensor histidine kinase, partial [bacterium]